MEFDKITHPVVKAAFTALQNRDRHGFINLLAPHAIFIHNGEPDDITGWADQFFFGKYKAAFTSVDKVADNGLSITAGLDSELAGKVQVLMKFAMEQNRITHLNAGRPD